MAQQKKEMIQGWKVLCQTDRIHDIRLYSGYKGNLFIILHENRRINVDVVGQHDAYPGSLVYLRIDHNKPYSAKEGGWSGKTAQRIIDQLKTAKTVITRYTKWPEELPIDDEVNLDGFTEMWTYLNTHIRPK